MTTPPTTRPTAVHRGPADRPARSGLGTVFAVAATVEAFTWAGLLVGMFLEHITKTTDAGVTIFGRLHGVAFLVYLAITVVAAARLRWPAKYAILAVLAAVPPLTTLAFESFAHRHGLLSRR